jgi:glycosyltransferase involved in cell wall biosynthesis
VLFLGRIEDGAKGCFLLPKIISHVQGRGADVQWQIAGDGPDLAELKRRCHGFSNVRFLGRIPYEQVPQVLAQADVYIFPSRYEGFGLSLVEAMAAGCVPVASEIRGVSDNIIEHSKTGYLFPNGNWKKAADYIVQLACDPDNVQQMSAAASESVQSRFSIETVAEQYLELMDKVLAKPRPLKKALDVRKWKYPGRMRARLRTSLPNSIKMCLRALREVISQ